MSLKKKEGGFMELETLLAGESINIEYKQDIPSKSDRYMKSVIAFANGNGGKIVFGVEDKTNRVIGFPSESIPEKIDAITNAIWDSCEPKVPADVYPFEIEGKTRLKGAELESHGDHRVTMSLIIASTIADSPCEIKGIDCINISYPNFIETLEKLAK